MKMREMLLIAAMMLLAVAPAVTAQNPPAASGQSQATTKKAPAKTQAAAAPQSAEQQNIQEYIELLRTDVRKSKSQVMGAVMALDADQATKFWPIYKEYSAELDKINDLRVANIQEYAREYGRLTDDQADALIKKAMEYHKQRTDLLANYYERMRQSLGGVTAARFVQVENQLLLLIDLEINAQLPVAQ